MNNGVGYGGESEICGVGILVVPCVADAEKGIRFSYSAPNDCYFIERRGIELYLRYMIQF